MNVKFVVLSVLSLAFAGCIINTSGERVEDSRLIVDNEMFASHVRAVGQTSRVTPSGFLEVQSEFQNDDTSDFEFLYRFQWFDSDGILLEESSSPWRRAFAHGRDRFYLKSVAESASAKDFRLVIREK